MLVVCSILLVGFGLNILGDPDIDHLLTITCSVVNTAVFYLGDRNCVQEHSIEYVRSIVHSDLVNPLSWTIYNRHASNRDSSEGQTALVCTSTGITFSTFICIVFYHAYLYLKSTKLYLYFKRNKIKRGDRRMSGAVGESVWSAVDAPPHHPPTRTVIELREPLLTDT